MDLKELQRHFKNHLFNQESLISRNIVSDVLSREFRLGIYVNAYATRLIEVLENDYPVLAALMGEDGFYELCYAYIDHYPSTNPSLRWFGRHLPGFLKDNSTYSNQAYLSEMAAFEWNLVDAFSASDKPAIGQDDVA